MLLAPSSVRIPRNQMPFTVSGSLDVIPLKRLLIANDGGVWGQDADEGEGTIVLRSTDQLPSGAWRLVDPARRLLSAREQATATLKEGDLLVTKSSGSAAHIGKTTYVTPAIAQMRPCFSNFMQRLRVSRRMEPRVVWYWLNSDTGRQQLNQLSNTTTGLANLNGEILGRVLIPVAPIEEQRRIATFLDYETARIDELVKEQERLASLLDEERSGVIRDALTVGFLPEHRPVESGSRWFPTVPGGWSVLPLKRLLTANDGGAWGNDPEGNDDTIVLRSTEQTVDGEWRITDPAVRSLTPAERAKTLLREGDLLVTKSSGSDAHIGKTTYVTPEVAGLHASYSNFMQRLRISNKLHPRIVWYVMNSEIGRQQLAFASNTTTGLSNLNAELLGSLHVPVAPKAQQLVLLDYLDRQTKRLRSLTHEVEVALSLLRERRAALITAAVTGQIDVSSWRPPDDWRVPEPA